MFKKIAIAALIVAPVSAMAVDTLDFTIEANVPTDRQYVRFLDQDFGTQTQTMQWDGYQQQLENISTTLEAFNNVGNIEAYLSSVASLSDGTNDIPLKVEIGNKTLGVGAPNKEEIVPAANAGSAQTLNMVVSPNFSGTYTPGDYTGTVTMMFEHGI
ncbi:CS1 type fimbrial major subunit [Pantoea sp. CTOTU49201]|uniref:CS1 type fimbrial major subunit n=1 Tax=Pantoea sp. CTOTU49201 TaxID=2953855 RepID=UPI002898BC1C|nr:CS1 type fimbrial major subunit [Pantoea sp. CTOTU49201]